METIFTSTSSPWSLSVHVCDAKKRLVWKSTSLKSLLTVVILVERSAADLTTGVSSASFSAETGRVLSSSVMRKLSYCLQNKHCLHSLQLNVNP